MKYGIFRERNVARRPVLKKKKKKRSEEIALG